MRSNRIQSMSLAGAAAPGKAHFASTEEKTVVRINGKSRFAVE